MKNIIFMTIVVYQLYTADCNTEYTSASVEKLKRTSDEISISNEDSYCFNKLCDCIRND